MLMRRAYKAVDDVGVTLTRDDVWRRCDVIRPRGQTFECDACSPRHRRVDAVLKINWCN